MLGRLVHWIGNARAAGKLRRRARQSADPAERASLLLQAATLGDDPDVQMEAAVALAQAGRLAESAGSWRAAIHRKPLQIPDEAQLAALAPVLPQVAGDILAALTQTDRKVLGQHWKLERRGSFDGEERWRLEQQRHDTHNDLLPVLRYVALAIAHTAPASGRLRIDCDRLDPDTERYNPLEQMGEAIVTWDESLRITGVRLQE